jgi:hypothetical protein
VRGDAGPTMRNNVSMLLIWERMESHAAANKKASRDTYQGAAWGFGLRMSCDNRDVD